MKTPCKMFHNISRVKKKGEKCKVKINPERIKISVAGFQSPKENSII